jgi:uncharacterized protein YccT (UPF0319 family)
MENTEDVEKIPVKETDKEDIEIVIVNIKKVEEGIVQDQDKRSTEKEDKADQILQESE